MSEQAESGGISFPASVRVHQPDQQKLRKLRAAADHTAHVAECAALALAAANVRVDRARAHEQAAIAATEAAQEQLDTAEREATEAAQRLTAFLAATEQEG